jgi:hypothetical protein
MARKERHVVTNPGGGWDSKRENAERAKKGMMQQLLTGKKRLTYEI